MPVTRKAGVHGYLGPLGRLIELPSVAALSADAERPASTTTTLGGRKIAFVGQQAHRKWTVSVRGMRPAEAGVLDDLLRASAGPHVWVSPYAQVTNVMTPDAANFVGKSMVRSGVLVDGSWSASSLAPSTPGGSITAGHGVVVPGYPVTAAVYGVSYTTRIAAAIKWVTAEGVDAAPDVSGVYTPSDGSLVRASITATAPQGAARALLYVTGADYITRPTITWTDGVRDWAPGQGCMEAIVTGWSGEVRATYAGLGLPRTKHVGFDIEEVG